MIEGPKSSRVSGETTGEIKPSIGILTHKKVFEELLNNFHEGLILVNKDYTIINWNKQIEELSGLRSDEAVGKNILEVFPGAMGKGMKGIKELIDSARMGKQIPLVDVPYKTLKGREGHMCIRTIPISELEGEVTGVLVVVTDRTEKKRLEIEREIIHNINRIVSSSFLSDISRVIASQLRRIIDFDRMSIALLDESGQKFEVFALAQEYGDSEIKEGYAFRKKGSLIEKVFSTGKPYIVKDTTNEEFWSDKVLLKEGIRSRLGFPLECKGTLIGTINFASKYPNNFSEKHFRILEQIAPQLAIAIENTRLFNTLRESEKKYKDLYDNAPDMYFTHDENGRILDCNQAGADLLGYSKEELIGRTIFDIQTPKTQDIVKSLLPKNFRGLFVKGLELELLRKDGGKIDVSVNGSPIYNEAGKIVAIRSTYRDVTARKKMEEQLIEMERLASTGRLVASVAHEINNPLAGILNYLHLLSAMITDEEQNKLLQLVVDGCNRIETIVRHLLESHKHAFDDKVNIDVNLCIRNVTNLLESRVRLFDINLIQELDGNLPQISCDPMQIEEVFVNLIVNAIDAMPNGGTLRISTSLRGDNIQISFTDTGCGIPEDEIPRLFEPFHTTKKGVRFGLGLWSSLNIVKTHNGTLHVESKVGKGTTMSVLLPWAKS